MSTSWRAPGLADIARHVIGCRLTQDTWILKMRVDDVDLTGNILWSLRYGGDSEAGGGAGGEAAAG